MQTFDAKLVVSGKLNFLAYCFRAKNYYGMVDKQEMVLTPNQPQLEGLTPNSSSASTLKPATLRQNKPKTSDFYTTFRQLRESGQEKSRVYTRNPVNDYDFGGK